MGRTWAMGAYSFATNYSLDKMGALCLLTPFATSIMLHSLMISSPGLEDLYFAFLEYINDTHQPLLIISPARIFLMCILILVAITIMSQPYYKYNVPSNFLHLPFKPIEVTSFTSGTQPCIIEEVALKINAGRSSCSHQIMNANTLPSSSLNREANMLLMSTEDNLTDDEVNKRFSAFIASRLAAMKREMME